MIARIVVAAIAILLAAAVVVFSYLGLEQSKASSARIDAQLERAAAQAVDLTVAGLENTMLQGTGVTVNQLLEASKQHAPDAEIHVFDARGYEVFAKRPPPPAPAAIPPDVARLLEGASRFERDGVVYRPLDHEDRCKKCHSEGTALRGVLQFRPQATAISKRHAIVSELVRASFVHVMTSHNAHLLDDYFAELRTRAPTVSAIGVYGAEGDLRFGLGTTEVTPVEIAPLFTANAQPQRSDKGTRTTMLVPLPNGERCKKCHEDPNPVRGVLAVTFDELSEPSAAVSELEGVMDSAIRVMMMSSLGRLILVFLRRAVELGAISELVIYDGVGRTYFDNKPATPPADVATVLAATEAPPNQRTRRDAGRFHLVRSLRNKPECATCHGSDSLVRGAVTMSMPSTGADALQASTKRTQLFFLVVGALGATVLLASLVLLVLSLRRRVH